MNNSGRNDYLSISWLPAPGDVDNYVVTLSHDGRVVQSLVIAKSVSECSFSSLTPGRLYNVTITTRSGKYENHSFGQERTGEDLRRYRLYKNQPAMWFRASQICSNSVMTGLKTVEITTLLRSLHIFTQEVPYVSRCYL